jgi:hypothetical protein
VLKAAPWVRISSPSARVCAAVCFLEFRAALGFRCFSVSRFAPPPRPFLHFSVHLRSLHQHRPRRLSLGFCVEVFLPLIDFANGFSRRRSQARRWFLSPVLHKRCRFFNCFFSVCLRFVVSGVAPWHGKHSFAPGSAPLGCSTSRAARDQAASCPASILVETQQSE